MDAFKDLQQHVHDIRIDDQFPFGMGHRVIDQLIETLGKRMKVADAIGELKKQRNVTVLQTNRWNAILGKMILEGEGKGLSEEFVLRMFKAIHQEAINHQEKIINTQQ